MDLNDYAAYSLNDYLEDPKFRSWVLEPDADSDRHWKAVFGRFPEQQPVAGRARLLLQEMAGYFQPDSLQEQAIDEAFVRRLQETMKAAGKSRSSFPRRRKIRRRLSVAAAAVFLLAVASWFWFDLHSNHLSTVRTAYAEWKTLQLPDGSTVNLNANSEISYSSHWKAGADREVWLQGEAFFEVVKDVEGAKFTVFTGDLAVEVLGTAFNVLSRGEETRVFLKEGKVRVDLGEDERLLELPGDFISYSSREKEIKTLRQASEESHTSWKDGSLIMPDDSTVAEAVKKIEEIFGYEVEVKDPALLEVQKRITIPMDKIEEAIPILESIFQTEIKLEDQRLIIY